MPMSLTAEVEDLQALAGGGQKAIHHARELGTADQWGELALCVVLHLYALYGAVTPPRRDLNRVRHNAPHREKRRKGAA